MEPLILRARAASIPQVPQQRRDMGTRVCLAHPDDYLRLWPSVVESDGGWTEAKGENVEAIHCLRCRREILAGDKSVAVYMFAQTVGVRPRQKSSAQRICFCPQCAVSLAMGLPPEGALNMSAWEMIRDLVSAEPSLNEAAWDSLRGVVGLLGPGNSEARRRAG